MIDGLEMVYEAIVAAPLDRIEDRWGKAAAFAYVIIITASMLTLLGVIAYFLVA